MRLDLIVGPTGAGKTTFVQRVLAPAYPASVFVNADEIAKQRWPDDQVAHAYDAAVLAAQTRDELVSLGRPFIAETVFSHPSKLELIVSARDRGYWVALHVIMVPVEVSVERVCHRHEAGGHDVPEDKIRSRWPRVWGNVSEAGGLVHTATCYDSTQWGRFAEIAVWADGTLASGPRWQTWAPAVLSDRWPNPA